MSFLIRIYNWILLFDEYGPTPGINHLGSARYSSILGVLISIGSLAFAIAINFSYLRDAYENTNPSIISVTEPYLKPQRITRDSFKFYVQIKYFNITAQFSQTIRSHEYPKIPIGKLTYNSSHYIEEFLSNTSDFNFLRLCSDRSDSVFDFFEKYNEDMVFNPENFTEAEIHNIRHSSLCLPETLNDNLKLLRNGHQSISLTFLRQDLKKIADK